MAEVSKQVGWVQWAMILWDATDPPERATGYWTYDKPGTMTFHANDISRKAFKERIARLDAEEKSCTA